MQRDPDPSSAAGERLVPLRSLPGYRLADDEPDIHGWDVASDDGRRIGTVEALLVDPRSAEVVALAVTAGREIVVVPMERTRPDLDRRVVRAAVTRDDFARLPRTGAPGAASASAAAPADAPADAPSEAHPGVTVHRTADGEEVIRVPIVREELVVERRPVVKEVVVIRKRAAVEERVIEADLQRERLEVDRTDVDGRRER